MQSYAQGHLSRPPLSTPDRMAARLFSVQWCSSPSMKRFFRDFSSLVALLALGGVILPVRDSIAKSGAQKEFAEQGKTPLSKQRGDSFFPVAVWYSGGKARAPMLESITADSPALWKQDLDKIKGLGFNTVRTWVEWNVGEPEERQYHLENLDLLLQLANE